MLTPTASLLAEHLPSLPYLKVEQLPDPLGNFLSAAPSVIPALFHIATAMNAENHIKVNSASTARKAYALAKRWARLHMGVMDR